MASEDKPLFKGNNNLMTVCLLIMVLLLLAYAVFGNRGVLRIFQTQRQQQELQQQLADMQQQQQQLRQEIERSNSDRDYWEQLARTRLGMVREGELIYYLPDITTEERGR